MSWSDSSPRDGPPKVIVMLEAYLDESGIHDGATVCIIAGYFGRRNAWRKLEASWRETLNEFGVPLEDFHAKDMVKAVRQGPLIEKLANCIAKQALFPVSAGIVVGDFKSRSEAERRWFTGASARTNPTGAPNKPYFTPLMNILQ